MNNGPLHATYELISIRIMQLMKAAFREQYCYPDKISIKSLEIPLINPDEILIRVRSTTVNRTDCANLTAKPFIMRFVLGLFKPKLPILGTDFAGEIVSIGSNIKSFAIGDRVFGFHDTGIQSQAEYLKCKEGHVFKIPEGINFQQAAASLEGAHYAYTFLHKIKLSPNQSVMVLGASGGIGSALIQFLNQYDIKISATCSSKNLELIKSLGAEVVYDYTKEDFTKSDYKYDFIFDTVGKSTYGSCKSVLKNNGVYISSELGPFSQNLILSMMSSIYKKKVIFPVPYSKSRTIPFIIKSLQDGSFKSVIDRDYPLEQISNAYEFVMSGQKTGNVTISI
jgi:NADPH:quinone reductase-like Zn-dependent oxidoreductase